MTFKYKALVIIAPLVFIFDQFTKWMVTIYISPAGSIPIIDGYIDLVFIRNKGAAFGFLAGMGDGFRSLFFYIVALIAVTALMVFYVRMKDDERILPVSVSLVFGGIFGNILDRIRFGAVTDFVSVHIKDVIINRHVAGHNFNIPLVWPAFNVADSAITIAMFLFVISAFKSQGGDS